MCLGSGFQPPRDEHGCTLSYEEYMERRGMPFTDAQKATREALWALIREDREWVGGAPDWLKYTGTPRIEFTPECKAAHKAIDEADRAARLLYETAKLVPSRKQ